MAITKELFGTLTNGQDITAYLLDNGNGVSARILNYGGIVRNLYVEDKNGVKTDVVLGRETMEVFSVHLSADTQTELQAANLSLTVQNIM